MHFLCIQYGTTFMKMKNMGKGKNLDFVFFQTVKIREFLASIRYSRVPISCPPTIVNFSIFFLTGHSYSNPPIINFQKKNRSLTYTGVLKLRILSNLYEQIALHSFKKTFYCIYKSFSFDISVIKKVKARSIIKFSKTFQPPYYSDSPIIKFL